MIFAIWQPGAFSSRSCRAHRGHDLHRGGGGFASGLEG